ncbi:MAG TPA: helix-turn-helix transcriptional regulator [Thermoanaerobaculia bacterium]|nr:helix-turn-helix transcriptional regulator [Thermoanaerobaculia bacterium]
MRELVDLAQAMKSLRGARTQREVALRADLSAATWNRYERGKVPRWPESKTFSKMAAGLGCGEERLDAAITEATRKRYAAKSAGRAESDIAEDAAAYGTDDPLRRAARDHFHRIAEEFAELYLLAIRPHPPS